MAAISEATAAPFTPRPTPGDLEEGEWRLVQSAEGKRTGKVHFQAKNKAAIEAVFAKIHGSAVEVDGMSHTIEIFSDFVKNPLLCGQ